MNLGEWLAGSAARVRSLWRGLRDRDAVEAEMAAEFRHHLELRTADLVRRGLTPEQAARQARIEFGHAEGYRIEARVARGLGPFDQLRFSALDVRLGARMLMKYPGLSLVAVIGMALAIAIAASAFSVNASIMDATVPLPDGDRIVAVRNTLIAEPDRQENSLRDFMAWRDELQSVDDLAAFTRTHKNLIIPGAGVHLVQVVRMTASGFKATRTAPVRGRPLLEQDERNDARVVVIAFEEWQQRFGADPEIIGRRVRLGSDEYTVVGVMPEGFRFPVDDGYWTPLVVGPAERESADAMAVTVFGRLAKGATLESAQAELTTVGTRMAAAYPETHDGLRPQILSYTRAFFNIQSPQQVWRAQLIQLFVSLLLVVIAINVAVLVYARTATRAGEIAVRTALGASRARVVTQLFAEALVLAGIAAVIGLTTSEIVLTNLQAIAERRLGEVPFWIELGLSPGVITYALVLAIVGAAIVGVAPALKATGRRVQTSLQQLSGHGARMQLGRGWTILIIAQVAIAVAVLPFAVAFTEELIGESTVNVGYPAEEFLEASLDMERVDATRDTGGASSRAIEQRFRIRAVELIRRLEGNPAVIGLTIRRPVAVERMEIELGALPGQRVRTLVRRQRVNRIDANFFALYGMPIVAGRAFTESEGRDRPAAVIVNQGFADHYFGGGLVLGRRLRFVPTPDSAGAAAGAWLEIVGVVRDFEERKYEPANNIYLPAYIADLPLPVSLAMRVTGRPATGFAPRIREIAAAVDPALQINGLVSVAERHRQAQQAMRYIAIGAAAAMLSVVLLSAAGIYAMMSFTVARRRREIGIRSALGADARRVLGSIFARASAQLSVGIVVGLVGTVALDRLTGRGPVHDGNAIALAQVAALMTVVGLLAAVVPARRGLAVQPTEALRDE